MTTSHLTTSRCLIMPPTIDDAPLVMALMTDPEVRRYLGGPASRERAEARAQKLANAGNPHAWVVHLRGQSSGGVGLISLTSHHDGIDSEISYEFQTPVWGVGIASETVGTVLAHALEHLDYNRLIAETQAANGPSRRLLERLGLRQERELERFGAAQVIYATGRS